MAITLCGTLAGRHVPATGPPGEAGCAPRNRLAEVTVRRNAYRARGAYAGAARSPRPRVAAAGDQAVRAGLAVRRRGAAGAGGGGSRPGGAAGAGGARPAARASEIASARLPPTTWPRSATRSRGAGVRSRPDARRSAPALAEAAALYRRAGSPWTGPAPTGAPAICARPGASTSTPDRPGEHRRGGRRAAGAGPPAGPPGAAEEAARALQAAAARRRRGRPRGGGCRAVAGAGLPQRRDRDRPAATPGCPVAAARRRGARRASGAAAPGVTSGQAPPAGVAVRCPGAARAARRRRDPDAGVRGRRRAAGRTVALKVLLGGRPPTPSATPSSASCARPRPSAGSATPTS